MRGDCFSSRRGPIPTNRDFAQPVIRNLSFRHSFKLEVKILTCLWPGPIRTQTTMAYSGHAILVFIGIAVATNTILNILNGIQIKRKLVKVIHSSAYTFYWHFLCVFSDPSVLLRRQVPHKRKFCSLNFFVTAQRAWRQNLARFFS